MTTRAERIRQSWPTEQEQAEISSMLLEECPGLSELGVRVVFKIRCRQWAEDAAATALADMHAAEDSWEADQGEAWEYA